MYLIGLQGKLLFTLKNTLIFAQILCVFIKAYVAPFILTYYHLTSIFTDGANIVFCLTSDFLRFCSFFYLFVLLRMRVLCPLCSLAYPPPPTVLLLFYCTAAAATVQLACSG